MRAYSSSRCEVARIAQRDLIDVRLLGNRQIALANLCVVLIAAGRCRVACARHNNTSGQRWNGLSATRRFDQAPALLLTLFAGPWCGVPPHTLARGSRCCSQACCCRSGGHHRAYHGRSGSSHRWPWCRTGIGNGLCSSGAVVSSSRRYQRSDGPSSVVRCVLVGSQVVAFMLATSTVSGSHNSQGVYPGPSAPHWCWGSWR